MSNASFAKIEALAVHVLEEDLPEVISEALASLYFENITVNDKFAVAAGQLTELEQYGNDRWDIKFEARLTWQLAQPVRFSITVAERHYSQMRKECAAKCKEIAEALLRFAALAKGGQERRSTAHGSAFFATEGELVQKGCFDAAADSSRFIVGRYGERRRVISIPEKDTHAHVLVCGPTGSGKSRAVFIPNLIRRLETNMLVTEAVAGERNPPTLYNATAGWRHTAGHKVFYFNPADLSSTRINPLDSIAPRRDEINRQNPERLNFYDSAAYVANVIMRNTKEESPIEDKVWGQSECHLLIALLLFAVGRRRDLNGKAQAGDGANLAAIRALLRLGPEAITEQFQSCPIALARLEYQAFLRNSSPNFRHGVVSGLMARLNPWVNPQIAALTEVTDFDVRSLKEELWTFYLATLITRPQHKPVAVLAFNYLLEMICDNKFAKPVTLLLDEFTNYGHIPDIEKKLTMTRNQELGMVLGIQHTGQLKKVYRDDAEAILAQPATQIYFRPRDIKTARTISDQLGYTTVTERQQAGRSFRTIERARKLLDESEVLRLAKNQVVVFMPDGNPVLAETFGPGEHNDFLKEALPERPVHDISDHVLDLCKPVRPESEERRPMRYYITRFLAGKAAVREFVWQQRERTSRFDERGTNSRFDHSSE